MSRQISEQEQQDITQKIDLYLKDTFKDKIKGIRASISFSSNTSGYFVVMARRSRFYDLYIRFNGDYSDGVKNYKTIVLARVSFEKTRKKFGSRLLYELIQITKQYGYEYIMIEGVSDNSRAFAKRLGFKGYIINRDSSQPAFSYFISINKLDCFLNNYL